MYSKITVKFSSKIADTAFHLLGKIGSGMETATSSNQLTWTEAKDWLLRGDSPGIVVKHLLIITPAPFGATEGNIYFKDGRDSVYAVKEYLVPSTDDTKFLVDAKIIHIPSKIGGGDYMKTYVHEGSTDDMLMSIHGYSPSMVYGGFPVARLNDFLPPEIVEFLLVMKFGIGYCPSWDRWGTTTI